MTHERIEAIVIGGSAGAIDALSALLPALPTTFALPVAVVLHIPPIGRSLLVETFASRCALPVKEAEDKEPLRGGVVYFAPADYHLLIETDGTVGLSVDEPVHFSRPAIDVLFESAADAYGVRLAGVLLSGANEDGARGLARIRDAGGVTLVQAPATASVATMPAAALRLAPADHVLSAADLGLALVAVARRGGAPC